MKSIEGSSCNETFLNAWCQHNILSLESLYIYLDRELHHPNILSILSVISDCAR